MHKIVTSKDLLFSAGTQYSVMTYMGKESLKEWIHVYVKVNYFGGHLKLTQHCKSAMLQ